MLNKRTFVFKERDGNYMQITVQEIADPDFGLYTWPCAPVLAQYIWYYRSKFVNRTLLELSAGTALPGLLAAKCGARVHLSDSPDLPKCLENIEQSCKLNDLSDIPVHGIKWGNLKGDVRTLPKLDFIIASDCFYSSQDFENIIVIVAYLLSMNKGAVFIFTYQERSASRSIEHLMIKWKLEASTIPLSAFQGDSPNIAGSDLPGSHTVKLYCVRSQ